MAKLGKIIETAKFMEEKLC